MTDIKFLIEPDETGLGRIVVDGKFYGIPSGAVAALARSFTAHDIAVSDEIERNREAIAELVGALKLALDSHNLMLPTDPPITAWEYRRVGEIGRAAITKHSTTTEKRK